MLCMRPQYAAPRREIERAGRWNSDRARNTAEAAVLNQHYLKVLSAEVCLANAGFTATERKSYIIPRSRGTALHDECTKQCIEFFYPGLYAIVNRACAAVEDKPICEEDPVSVTNHKFTEMLQMVTFYWLQDAVVLLAKYPELKHRAPWSTLLENEPASTAFRSFSEKVLRLGTVLPACLPATAVPVLSHVLSYLS